MLSLSLLNPLLGLAKDFNEPFLFTSRLGLDIILPCYERRRRHHDGLSSALTVEAEPDAAVIEEVELKVAPAAD